VLAIIGMATMLVSLAGSEVGAVTAGFGYLTISLYVSYWLPRVQSLAYVFLMSALYVLAIARAGWTQLLAPWMLTVATMLIVLFVLSALRQALESVANTDGLTGLINRRGLDWIIATNRTDHRERRRTIVLIDLDNFKELNDRKGHLAGDRALRDFGAACRQSLRPGDLALRTGGDEFVLILERLAADDIAPVIERLHASSTIRWSHGCAEWPPRADFDAAMAAADAALYRDKQHRRRQRDLGTPETT
jgi:diguanylate cyclase